MFERVRVSEDYCFRKWKLSKTCLREINDCFTLLVNSNTRMTCAYGIRIDIFVTFIFTFCKRYDKLNFFEKLKRWKKIVLKRIYTVTVNKIFSDFGNGKKKM